MNSTDSNNKDNSCNEIRINKFVIKIDSSNSNRSNNNNNSGDYYNNDNNNDKTNSSNNNAQSNTHNNVVDINKNYDTNDNNNNHNDNNNDDDNNNNNNNNNVNVMKSSDYNITTSNASNHPDVGNIITNSNSQVNSSSTTNDDSSKISLYEYIKNNNQHLNKHHLKNLTTQHLTNNKIQKCFAIGAEAVITLDKDKIIKNRIKKSYRISFLDEKIRKNNRKSVKVGRYTR
jgi:hypothetical protein